jgi:signal transduction histidine kinase
VAGDARNRTNLLPGDYLYRYANLVNTGGLAQDFVADVAGSGVMACAGGLQIAVDSCSLAWLHHQGGRAVMRTRGDASPAADPWTVDLTRSAVYRVRTVVPHAGIAWQFLHNTTRHTGGLLTWPGLMPLMGVAGIAIRTRRTRVPAPQHEARTVALREASYELRAPLSSIVGYTELLADAELDPAHAQIVETITRPARRLTDFADDLSARTA